MTIAIGAAAHHGQNRLIVGKRAHAEHGDHVAGDVRPRSFARDSPCRRSRQGTSATSAMMPRIIAQPTTCTRMKLLATAGQNDQHDAEQKDRRVARHPLRECAAALRVGDLDRTWFRWSAGAPLSASPQQPLRTHGQHDDHDHEGRDGRVILEIDLAELLGEPDDERAERGARVSIPCRRRSRPASDASRKCESSPSEID